MIKLSFCLRRLPELTREQFQDYWLDRHAPLVREVAPALRIRRYVQSHTADIASISAAVEARGGTPAYDGVAELWWDSVKDIVAVGETKEGRDAGRRLLADERNFIDLAQSSIFYVREHAIIG